jgi:aspartate oxidase
MVSVWEKETFFAPQDVVIAGSGFAGLWSAFFIKNHHQKSLCLTVGISLRAPAPVMPDLPASEV